MNILVAVNEKYLPPLSVMLYSLGRHNRKENICVYIMHLHISQKIQREFIQRIQNLQKRMQIKFIKVNEEHFKDISIDARYGLEANCRLIMTELLPRNIERILWLDTDLIIKGDVLSLYYYPNHGQYAVACEDLFTDFERKALFQKLKMEDKGRYFNSGVMLLYMNNLRKDFRNNEFIQWLRENPDKASFPDQNALNVCLKGNVIWASPYKYNLQLSRLKNDERCYLRKTKILHYNTKEKPWDVNYNGAALGTFWKYGIRVFGIKETIRYWIGRLK